ncbi:MAG TPA: aminoacyl-histidine dipeptidase [bacterium]|nr:aminoacyl-histidine dipeptidase [bacterium]
MSKLKDLGQPPEFWEYFEKITKIPRCSQNEEGVRSYIKEEAERFGFQTKVDNAGNLVVRILPKNNPKKNVVLQCHLDMVCEKNEEVQHDFLRDPLRLKIIEIENEKWVTAEGTTLGADNGVGISYLLTLMKKINNRELKFDTLGFDLLFTIDEEMGLRGAFKIDKNLIQGDFLINLDAEDEDTVTIGCAGGKVTFFQIKNETIKIEKEESRIPIRIFVYGLVGGHSGSDIHLGRGNAIKILSQIIWKLNKEYKIKINSMKGGNRTNAIPREAGAIFFAKEKEFAEIKDFINNLFKEIIVIFDNIEPNISIKIEKLKDYAEDTVLKEIIQNNLLNILYTIPNGPLSMHPEISDLVFNSSNLAVIRTKSEKIEIKLSQRSLNEYFKGVIWEKATTLFSITDLDVTILIDSDYPGWQPEFKSKLLSLTKEAYKDLTGKEIKVKAIHAGLECGILGKKFPHMEMISIGPKNIGAHSPNERVSIQSVGKIWNFLITLLGKL